MKLDKECRSCLYNSQLKKAQSFHADGDKFEAFKSGVKSLCENPPDNYCAPLLARDINRLHASIFGSGMDYSVEKSMFNLSLLELEEQLYSLVINSADPVEEGLKYAMAANYIDYARLSDLNRDSVDTVIAAARKTAVPKDTLLSFKQSLEKANTLCYLHDNCGEIVLDKILIRAIKAVYPHISVLSVVRGMPVINDVTEDDAKQIMLYDFAEVISNGTDIPGTYLQEISARSLKAIRESDVVLSKGLGNLETLHGNGLHIFYAFTCKCEHISAAFNVPLWASAFVEEK